MKTIINHERYGMRQEFDSVEQAQKAIRSCGHGFSGVTLTVDTHGWIRSEHGELVGAIPDPDEEDRESSDTLDSFVRCDERDEEEDDD